jgi:hypothetical protein
MTREWAQAVLPVVTGGNLGKCNATGEPIGRGRSPSYKKPQAVVGATSVATEAAGSRLKPLLQKASSRCRNNFSRAGAEGSRLNPLLQKNLKPAVGATSVATGLRGRG